MAPIASPARLPAALANLLASRSPGPQPHDAALSSPIAAVARRFHSLTTTRALLDAPSRVLSSRQGATTSTIPGAYPGVSAGPDPGTVVGITLGSVAGFLLLLWLVYTCLSMGNGGRAVTDTVSSYGTASVVTRKSRHRQSHSHSHRHSHRSPRRETVEVRTSRVFPGVAADGPPPPPGPPPPHMAMPMPMAMGGPPPPPPPGERIVMEETVRRSSSRGPPPRMVQQSDDDDEEVVVIEEHTPPRRHKSRSHKRRSSSARRDRESGYREVEPDRFAGGDAALRDIRRSSRHGR